MPKDFNFKNITGKITIFIAGLIITFIVLGIILWLFILPLLIKSDAFIKILDDSLKTFVNLDLTIDNPELKTSLKPTITFSVNNLNLKKEGKNLIELKDFYTTLNLNKILKKEIKLEKLKAKTLLVKADELLGLKYNIPENKEKSEWKLDYFNSDISLDDLEVSYFQNSALLEIYARDIALSQEKDYKNLEFNLEAYIKREGKTYADIVSSTLNEIKIYDNKLKIDDLKVVVNSSRLRLFSEIDSKNTVLKAKSDKFMLSDIFDIINSNFVLSNGNELLKPLNNPSGKVGFDVTMKNNELSGLILIDNTKANLKDLTNIPLNIQKGTVKISKEKIKFVDLKGYYGKSKNNEIKIQGDIKDYYKTMDSNIIIDTVVTNEFFKNYLSPLINKTVLYVSAPPKTRIIYKAKNGIMDIIWLMKLSKGVSLGVDDSKSPLIDFDRAVKGDFHIENNIFDVKNINYYIAPDIKRGVKLTPILILDAKVNMKNAALKNAGFKFGKEMPSEFLNLFAGKGFFKKGTIKGRASIIYKNNIPVLDADMVMDKVLIPSQRMFIKNAKLSTTPETINIEAQGGFKRARYDIKGYVVNKLIKPYTVKKMTLNVDEIDVERFMASVNNSNEQGDNVDITKIENENSLDIKDDNFLFDYSLVRIEDADLTINKGHYKDLNFGNIKADLTLDDGILNVKSNKFDIAEGTSALKATVDLKNIKYYLKLGIREVNSSLMAKVLFNLEKEITGKASGLIELNSDKSLKLNGDVKFKINEGTIGKIGLVEYLLKIASVFRNPLVMISPGTLMDIISVPEGKFDKITGEMKIEDNIIKKINIKSYSSTLSALIRGRMDLERHDVSMRIYTRFSSNKKTMFNFLRNISLNVLANKVQLNSKNDTNYYKAELEELPQIDVEEEKTQVFLTSVEGDVEHNNYLSSLKRIK